ncbi:MAG TPA: response regulator [Verrucomicrobiae bacterium]|nr:response regulator [Verrucomicrobiae bacterium]
MKKILLIEDDQVFANVYRNKLLLEGFEVEVANDGELGYQRIQQFRPDAVLLDLLLPKLPGLELLKRIRSEADTQSLPVVVFTNTYLTTSIQEARAAGATKCMTKSTCTPADVISTVRSLLTDAVAESPSQTAEPEERTESAAADVDIVAELLATFSEEFPTTIVALRAQLQSLCKVENEAVRVQQLSNLGRLVHGVAASAGIVGLTQLARLAAALESLLKELQEKPRNINASTLRTVASAVDCLAIVFERGEATAEKIASARILVVDDEIISRRAVTHALEKAKLTSVAVDDPLRALNLTMTSRFDLVVLDVDMPNMNGYELCSKIRTLPAYKKTPVVFVTSLNDFEARANSTMSGGNDFIAKPFLFTELAVKALIYVLRSQLPEKR